MILQALARGLAVLGCHKKAIVYGYLLNLAAALLLFVPFVSIFDESLGPGLYRERMTDRIDYDWYAVFREEVVGFAASFSPWVSGAGPLLHGPVGLLEGSLLEFPLAILCLGGLYVLLNSFLVAAAVGSFALDPGGTSSREFLRTGATYLGRFLRLALLSLILFWVADRWLVQPLLGLFLPLVREATSDRNAFVWSLGPYLLWGSGLILLDILFGYARVKTAAEDRTSVLLALLSAMGFCRRHLVSAVSLYLLLGGMALAGMAAYLVLDSVLPAGAGWSLIPALLCQQLLVGGRIFFKLLFYSGQLQHFFLVEEGEAAARREADPVAPAGSGALTTEH